MYLLANSCHLLMRECSDENSSFILAFYRIKCPTYFLQLDKNILIEAIVLVPNTLETNCWNLKRLKESEEKYYQKF